MNIREQGPDYWNEGCRVLAERDVVLARSIHKFSGEVLQKRADAFAVLLQAITGQQLSVKAASAIWNRIQEKVDPLDPECLITQTPETLQKLGLSRKKAEYFQAAAQFFLQHPECMQMHWSDYDDMAKQLITIKGVGLWTIEMVGIFHLNHPDIFPAGDLGVRRAIEKGYAISCTPKEAEEFSHRWKPYRTIATWYLWRSIDTQISY